MRPGTTWSRAAGESQVNTSARLAAYSVGLIASFGIAFGLGRAVGPVEPSSNREAPSVEIDHGSTDSTVSPDSTGTDGSVPVHGGGHP